MDFTGKTVTYSSLDTFGQDPSLPLMDCVGFSGFNAETGEPELVQRVQGGGIQREGRPLIISLADYNIPMIHENGQFLLPLHTAFDLIIGLTTSKLICFNRWDLRRPAIRDDLRAGRQVLQRGAGAAFRSAGCLRRE